MDAPELKKEFYACIEELLKDPAVQAMDRISQHADGVSCLDHSIFVAYMSFSVCRRLGLNAEAAARAGLLHDIHLEDWKKEGTGLLRHLVRHPRMALENAERFGLSELERDIILNHMWPVTLRHIPHYRESVAVNMADKLCAAAEMLHIYSFIRSGAGFIEAVKRSRPKPKTAGV